MLRTTAFLYRGIIERLRIGGLLSGYGAKPIPGFQLRYMYFIDPKCRKKLTVPEIPFSRIDELGAGMYKGEKVSLLARHSEKLRNP